MVKNTYMGANPINLELVDSNQKLSEENLINIPKGYALETSGLVPLFSTKIIDDVDIGRDIRGLVRKLKENLSESTNILISDSISSLAIHSIQYDRRISQKVDGMFESIDMAKYTLEKYTSNIPKEEQKEIGFFLSNLSKVKDNLCLISPSKSSYCDNKLSCNNVKCSPMKILGVANLNPTNVGADKYYF